MLGLGTFLKIQGAPQGESFWAMITGKININNLLDISNLERKNLYV